MKSASFCFILFLVAGILFHPSSADEPDQNSQLEDVISPPENGDAKQPAEQNKDLSDEETANAGEEFLNEATRLKISAVTFDDMERVIQLCMQGLAKGLNEQNKLFAKQLIVSTRFERASRICQEIFDRVPPNENWLPLARVALADLELAVRQQDNLPEAHLLIGRLQSLPGGDRKRARAEFDKALAQSENNPAIQAMIFALRGEIAEDPEKQLADFNKALELQPELSTALRSRGIYYMNSNHPEKAVADFRKAARLEPGDPRIHEILALSLLIHGKLEESLESLNRAIDLDPDGASALAYRARIYLQQTKLDLALADINRAIELVTDNLSWRLVRGQIYFEQGNINKALAEVERVLAVDAKVLDAVRLRAAILATDDQMQEAIAGLQRAVEAMPENNELLMSLAIFYATNNQTQQALETYNKLLNRPVPHSPVYRSRGDLLLNLGRQAEAVTNYEKALELEPEDAGVLNNLAWVLATSPEAEIRDGDRSLKLATQACQATEYKKAHILSTLAAAYAENGDFKSAIDWSSQAVALGDEGADDQLEAELKSYQAGKPWREIQGSDKEPENSEAAAEETSAEDQVDPSEPPLTGGSGDTSDAAPEERVAQ